MTGKDVKYTKITFNNHHGNHDTKKQESFEVNINNGWSIMNYDDNQKISNSEGLMKLSIFDNQKEYIKGKQTKCNDCDIKMNSNKFEIFKAIVNMTDEDGEKGSKNYLSEEDLIKAREDFKNNKNNWKPLNVKQFRLDTTAGIATIIINNPNGEDEILRFRFNQKDVSNSNKPSETKETNKTSKTQETNKPSETEKTQETSNDNLLKPFFDEFLTNSKNYDNEIKRVAKEADVSEDFVKYLMFLEGDPKNHFGPKLEAYKDSKGVLTIGYGHTNSTKTFEFEEGYSLENEKQAFDILIKDIKYQKEQLLATIGEGDYNQILAERDSLAYALLDWTFNAGTKRFKDSLNIKENLKQENYFGLATTSLFNEGDGRRSFYRLLLAIDYMKPEDKKRVFTKFLTKSMKTDERSSYKDFILKSFTGDEKKLVKDIINEYTNEK